jgi:GTP-binding protein Era
MRSGFVAIVGRPNVGKSSLVNALCGEKVSIVTPVAQTTRRRVRGVMHRPDAQVVLVDTPGLHEARTALGRSANASAREALGDVDLACLVVDATAGWGPADASAARACELARAIVVVNKVDAAGAAATAACLAATADLGARAWHPVSARTGEGIAVLAEALVAAMPEGPPLYPPETVRETDPDAWIAELVREELMRRTREEVPHSVATRVVGRDGRTVQCEIVVERESQKGIVIGAGGAMLAAVRAAVSRALPRDVRLELQVRVVRNWQRDEAEVARLVE